MNKFEELLVCKGLYDSINISIDDLEEIEKLLSGGSYNGYNIDCFCVTCNEKRIFESVDKQVFEERGFMSVDLLGDGGNSRKPKKETIFKGYLNKRYSLSFRCTREHNHSILFDLLIIDNKMIKIGQYPAFADISVGDTTKYKSVLKKKYSEYNKALGLFSHGIGIGSFVYLRRIIESLVFEKYTEVCSNISVTQQEFIHCEFKDKIKLLKDYLPKVLVDNRNLYGIVSKGIHELEESKCREMFPLVKAGIELILDDILAEKEREEKEKTFSKFVADTTGELNKNGN